MACHGNNGLLVVALQLGALLLLAGLLPRCRGWHDRIHQPHTGAAVLAEEDLGLRALHIMSRMRCAQFDWCQGGFVKILMGGFWLDLQLMMRNVKLLQFVLQAAARAAAAATSYRGYCEMRIEPWLV